MKSLQSLYPEIKKIIQNSIPPHLPQLEAYLERFIDPMMPEAMLPLASCQAVNGNPEEAIHVSAALLAFAACWRILDELEDQDRPGELWKKIGAARAWNYASIVHILSHEILSKAPLHPSVFQRVNQSYINAFLRIAIGQDRDLTGLTQTIEDYWLTIELKTAVAYATACATGAMVETDDPKLIQACGTFGHHLGLAIQIFNDMESIWEPDGVTDLRQGKMTLPLLYALQFPHPERDELLSLVKANEIANHSEKIKEVLDKINTKRFLIWAALKERDQALAALKVCPGLEGKEVLESYITGMFGDLEALEKASQTETES